MRSRERYVKQYPEDGSLCQLNTEETEKCVVNDECCKSAATVAGANNPELNRECFTGHWSEVSDWRGFLYETQKLGDLNLDSLFMQLNK